ncbi:MAG: hypothetical protein JWP53_1639 [Conexibacter sp.]|nr:hypothetical protein [Conexibacter sp.]
MAVRNVKGRTDAERLEAEVRRLREALAMSVRRARRHDSDGCRVVAERALELNFVKDIINEGESA